MFVEAILDMIEAKLLAKEIVSLSDLEPLQLYGQRLEAADKLRVQAATTAVLGMSAPLRAQTGGSGGAKRKAGSDEATSGLFD
eukprot:9232600-Heterocapsa_arctica.AAC.1